ncbi:MAG: hypothetical protein ABGW87_14360 [Sphingomonadaceae bacterium]
MSALQVAFHLYTAPLAWFVQFNLGVMLTDWPCFPSTQRREWALNAYEWSHAAAIAALLIFAAVAAFAGWRSWRLLLRTKNERAGGHDSLAEIGHGRTRFVALWGTILGGSFSLASLATLVAFAVVPRCLG